MMRKFFKKKVFEPHNSVDSIEDLPRDSEEELDQPGFSKPQSYPQLPAEQPQHQQPQEVDQEEPAVPTTSRTLITIRINPLGRPFSNIYQNIESPQYDTYSEESKDHEEVTNDRSKSTDSKDEKRLRRVEIEPFSIDEQDTSESCVVKCFCIRRRR